MLNQKMKILTLNVSDTTGGAARAAYRIHHVVCAAGVEGEFLVKYKQQKDPKVISTDRFDNYKSLKIPFRWVQRKIKNKLQQLRWKPYSQREEVFLSDLRGSNLHGALQKLDYDILHLHWINLRFIDIHDLAKINKPIVWTLHDCWPFTGICHYFYNCERYIQSCGCCPHLHSQNTKDLSHKVWREKMKVFSNLNIHVVCPSNWLANAARKSSMFKHFPVSVIPNPIDSNFFIPADKTEACHLLDLNPAKTYILYGAINALNDSRKGFIEFKKCMQYFEENYNSINIVILVFGSNEKANLDLKNIAQKDLGMLNDQQLLAAYRAANVMIVPSLSENLSNIIMESLSCGTPVVAFNIGGNSDMIKHQQNGYLAIEEDIKDLACGVKWCLDNNSDCKLSDSARKAVLDNFTTQIVSKRYINVYSALSLNNIQ